MSVSPQSVDIEELELSNEHIKNGVRFDCNLCVIAQCLLQKYKNVRVRSIVMVDDEKFTLLPRAVILARKFDYNDGIMPGKLILNRYVRTIDYVETR